MDIIKLHVGRATVDAPRLGSYCHNVNVTDVDESADKSKKSTADVVINPVVGVVTAAPPEVILTGLELVKTDG